MRFALIREAEKAGRAARGGEVERRAHRPGETAV